MKYVLILFLALSLISRAQDSTFKEYPLQLVKQISLSSYGDTIAVESPDSTLNRFHRYWLYQYNGMQGTGNLGGPIQTMLVDEFDADLTPSLSSNPYRAYYYDDALGSYYNTKVPFTSVSYFNGAREEQLFNITHTQNINPNANIGINFRRISSVGFYADNKNVHSNARVFGSFNSSGGRYYARVNAFVNLAELKENGGITYDSSFTENTVDNRLGMAVNLNNAENNLDYRGVRYKHSYKFYNRDSIVSGLRSIAINHDVRYSYEYNRFDDQAPDSLYYNPFFQLQSASVQDVVSLWKTHNKLGLQFTNSKMAAPELGVVHGYYTWNNNRLDSSMNQLGVYLRLPAFQFTERSEVSIYGEYIFDGFGEESYHANAALGYNISDSLNTSLRILSVANQPDISMLNYYSSQRSWINRFANQQTTRISVDLIYRKWNTSLSGSITSRSNFIYFDESALPQQLEDDFQTVGIQFKTHQHHGIWHLTVDAVYQMLKDDLPLRAPAYYAVIGAYAEIPLFKKAMFTQVGLDVFYSDEYLADAYLPLNRSFHIQNELALGAYPFFDLYLALQIKKVKGFVKYAHANAGLSGYDYLMTPSNPMNDGQFRFGINWTFMN